VAASQHFCMTLHPRCKFMYRWNTFCKFLYENAPKGQVVVWVMLLPLYETSLVFPSTTMKAPLSSTFFNYVLPFWITSTYKSTIIHEIQWRMASLYLHCTQKQ
jgi:hypothetical protein